MRPVELRLGRGADHPVIGGTCRQPAGGGAFEVLGVGERRDNRLHLHRADEGVVGRDLIRAQGRDGPDGVCACGESARDRVERHGTGAAEGVQTHRLVIRIDHRRDGVQNLVPDRRGRFVHQTVIAECRLGREGGRRLLDLRRSGRIDKRDRLDFVVDVVRRELIRTGIRAERIARLVVDIGQHAHANAQGLGR